MLDRTMRAIRSNVRGAEERGISLVQTHLDLIGSMTMKMRFTIARLAVAQEKEKIRLYFESSPEGKLICGAGYSDIE